MSHKPPAGTGAQDPRFIRLAALKQRQPHRIDFDLSGDDRAAVAEALGLLALDKARLTGELRPTGKLDWDFDGMLGATATQSCVVTLAPVRSRIDEPLQRRYRAELGTLPEGDEIEMPEDESLEPLPESIDLLAVFEESLALALPPYPRAEGAEIGAAQFTEPGKTPMTDEAAKPFAGLAGLRNKLEGGEN